MYFTTQQICPAEICKTSIDVFINEQYVPDKDMGFNFSCPTCGDRIAMRSSSLRKVNLLPKDAVIARRTSILLVDDEPDICELLSLVLSLAGFYVRTCSSRDDAVEMLKREYPDLMIVDWHMPGMSLERFMDIINERYRGLPTILYSAATTAASKAQALSIPCVSKTGDLDDLVWTIRTMMHTDSHCILHS